MIAKLNTYKSFIQESIKDTWEIWKEIFNYKDSKIKELENDNIELEKILKKFKENDSFSSLSFSENTIEYEIFKRYWVDANQWLWVWKVTLKNLISSNKNYIKSLEEFTSSKEKFVIQNLDRWYFNEFTFPPISFDIIDIKSNKKDFSEKFEKYFSEKNIGKDFIVGSYVRLLDKNITIVDWLVYELDIDENWKLKEDWIKLSSEVELEGMKIVYWEQGEIKQIIQNDKISKNTETIEFHINEILEEISWVIHDNSQNEKDFYYEDFAKNIEAIWKEYFEKLWKEKYLLIMKKLLLHKESYVRSPLSRVYFNSDKTDLDDYKKFWLLEWFEKLSKWRWNRWQIFMRAKKDLTKEGIDIEKYKEYFLSNDKTFINLDKYDEAPEKNRVLIDLLVDRWKIQIK